MTNPDPKLANPWSRRPRLMAAALMAVGLLAAAAALWSSASKPARLAPVSKVTVALPTQLKSATVIVALSQGLFTQAGVEVASQPFALGKDALKSMLEGKADLAVVADTPFMYAMLGGKEVALLAGISRPAAAWPWWPTETAASAP